MNVFYEFKNTLVNISKIREVSLENGDAVRITFDDDSAGVYNTHGEADRAVEQLGKTAVQLVPCTVPMFNVYKEDNGAYLHERVPCLALCADGSIRSIAGGDYIDFADDVSNFVGFFDENALKNFPETQN